MRETMSIWRTLSFLRLYNWGLYAVSTILSRIFRQPFLFNQPWAVTIEPSAACQLSCPECPVGLKQIKRDSVIMSTNSFSEILKGLSHRTFWLNLYFQGEPLLDDSITEKIKLARKRKMHVVLSTNALALDEKKATGLCESGVSKIIISLDGADEDTYLKYRAGGDFQQVLNSIRYLRTARKNKSMPLIEVQMLVFSYNESQKKELRKTALKLGADKVVFKSPQFYDSSHASKNMSTLAKYQRYEKQNDGTVKLISRKRTFCKRLWNTIVINSDGDVSACCYDKFSNYIFGNALDQNASSIWKNKEFNLFRKEYLKGNQKNICRNCG